MHIRLANAIVYPLLMQHKRFIDKNKTNKQTNKQTKKKTVMWTEAKRTVLGNRCLLWFPVVPIQCSWGLWPFTEGWKAVGCFFFSSIFLPLFFFLFFSFSFSTFPGVCLTFHRGMGGWFFFLLSFLSELGVSDLPWKEATYTTVSFLLSQSYCIDVCDLSERRV